MAGQPASSEVQDRGAEPLTVTLQEAKRLTGLGATTLYGLINERRLETVKIGRRVLVSYASVKALVAPGEAGQ